MSTYHKFIKQAPTNMDFDYPRGSVVDGSMFDALVSDSTEQVPIRFGQNLKDVLEFSVYDADNNILQSKIIEREESYISRQFDFVDYDKVHRIGTINTFDKNYLTLDDGTIVISPTHELRELGYTEGSHRVGISFRNDIIGSTESSAKLMIVDIAPSRMEVKIIPKALKTTKKPLEVALNFEYENFISKRMPVSSIYNETYRFIKREGINTFVNRVISDNEIEGYNDLALKSVDILGYNSIQDLIQNVEEAFVNVKKLYFNILLWKYNEAFRESRFFEEYVKCVDNILDNDERFSNRNSNELLIEPHDFYRKTLLSQYNSYVVSQIYNARYSSYFTSVLIFDNGIKIPAITTAVSTENINDLKKHRPVVVKLINPLPTDIKVGSNFFLANTSYSDDIIQNVVLYKITKPSLYKMRGPSITKTSMGGSSKYTLEKLENTEKEINRNQLIDSEVELTDELKSRLDEIETEWRDELYGTPIEISDEISRYFHNNIEDSYLNVDYREFNNFIKYSSARKRLDVFIFKLSKLSEIDRQMEQIRRAWRTTESGKFSKLSYDSQMQTLRLEKNKILYGFDGYERFLYFEDIEELTETARDMQNEIDQIELDMARRGETQKELDRVAELKKLLTFVYVSWPRQDFDCEQIDDWSDTVGDYVYGDAVVYENSVYLVVQNKHPSKTDIPGSSDSWEHFCNCGECVGKKIPMNSSSYTFLSSRTYYKPQPIPASMQEFTKSSAYSWYSLKAREADFYDKHNDNSLINNTPEFITRDDENSDYFDFLKFVGHQFDLIHLYVDGIGTIKKPTNNPEKGIPNELVSHMLDYFGGGFSGYDGGEVNALVNQVKSKEHLDFIKKFKDRKNIIWRRILNNLPFILKSIGTEKSVRALFRCYGVPDYLFRIREFGGIEYSTDINDQAIYSFDTFDYYLNITQNNQYVEIDWGSENYEINSLEFRFGFDENDTDPYEQITIISVFENWSFGYEPSNSRRSSLPRIQTNNTGEVTDIEQQETEFLSTEIVGRFYFELNDNVNNEPRRVYVVEQSTNQEYLNPFGGYKFDVLIRRDVERKNQGLQVYVKRAEQHEIVYNGYVDITTDEYEIKQFYEKNSTTKLTFGNFYESNFRGRIDRIRIYETELSEQRFENHILFNQSYDVDNPETLENVLLFKANFDYPYSLCETLDRNHGIIENTSFRNDTPKFARCYNFTKSEFPFDFSGVPIRHYSKLPSYGSQVFNNNKIRLESQDLITQLSVSDRSTLKSNDRLTADTNTVGIYFGSSDLINHEIIRFFGNFKLGDYIGNPEDLYNDVYNEFKQIKHMFFKHGFGKLDFSTYLNIVESYVDPSLFDNIKKLVPARSRLIAGLVVEPTLLERPKIKRRPIDNELFKINDINFDLGIRKKDFVIPANKRATENTLDEQILTGFNFNAKQITSKSKWYPTEFNMNSVTDVPNNLMYEVDCYQGLSSNLKIETTPSVDKRFVRSQNKIQKYEAIKIAGQIVINSYFDCLFFGKFGSKIPTQGSQKFKGYIHKDTLINGIHPKTSGKYNHFGYTEFSFLFNGHRVVGKLYGDFIGQIQEGTVGSLRVVGNLGGRTFDDCSKSDLNGSINNTLIKKLKYARSGNLNYETTNSSHKVVDRKVEDGNINSVKIPETIEKSVPVDISFNTEYKIQNSEQNAISTSGNYTGNMQIDVSAIFVPPKITSYQIKWERGNFKKNDDGQLEFYVRSEILDINKSSYDYIPNIKKIEYIEKNLIDKNDLRLKTKYVSHKSTSKIKEQENILNSLKNSTCDKLKIEKYKKMLKTLSEDAIRYELTGDAYVNGYDEILFYVSVKPPLHLKVGDRIYLQDLHMKYDWCGDITSYIDFNERYYTISKITKNEETGNFDIEFPHGETNFSTKCAGTYDSGGTIGKVPSILDDGGWDYDIGKIDMYYEYDIPYSFEQKLRFDSTDANRDGKYDTHKEPIKISVKNTNGVFDIDIHDINQVGEYNKTWSETFTLSLGDNTEKKVNTNKTWFFGDGLVTNEYIPEESCDDIYRLSVSVDISKLENKIVKPQFIDPELSIGDDVEVTFRKGTYLWHPTTRGIEIFTGRVLNMFKDKNKNDNVTIKDEYNHIETFVVNSTNIYSIKIIKDRERKEEVTIPFVDTYDVNLRGLSTEEQRYYPDKDFVYKQILIQKSISVKIEKPYEFYNIIDIGNPLAKIFDGKFTQHKTLQRNVFSSESKKCRDMHCRRSVSSVNTTIDENEGFINYTPPIVRKRKTSIEDGMGDSFWYLDDEPVTEFIGCGTTAHELSEPVVDICNQDTHETPTNTGEQEVQDPLNLDSLILHYDFEDVTTDPLRVTDKSNNERHGDIQSAIIRDGGESRSYRKICELDNNIRYNQDNTLQYIDVNNIPFTTNALTLGFWIRPTGVSADNIGIILNNSTEKNQRHGLILNPGGNQYAIGYVWNDSETSYNADLGANLVHDSWSYVVVIIHQAGFVRTFVNNYFVSNYDLGVRHENVTFENLEIGRFSGMIDDIRIYNEAVDYGDVPLSKQATGFVEQMYKSTRVIQEQEPHETGYCEMQEFNFKYYQPAEFVIANKTYLLHPGDEPIADPEIESKRKFKLIGGINSGQNRNATTEFMGKLCGTLTEMS